MILVVDEETDSIARKDTAEHKTPKPIVIDRYNFKRDVAGYLGTKRSHLSLFDVETKKTETLTSGARRRRLAELVARRTDDRVRAWPGRRAGSLRATTTST